MSDFMEQVNAVSKVSVVKSYKNLSFGRTLTLLDHEHGE